MNVYTVTLAVPRGTLINYTEQLKTCVNKTAFKF